MNFMSLPAALNASGNAWHTPWSVTAIAGKPQLIARFISAVALDTPSMLLIWVCMCSSTRLRGAWSSRTTFFCCSASDSMTTISLRKSS